MQDIHSDRLIRDNQGGGVVKVREEQENKDKTMTVVNLFVVLGDWCPWWMTIIRT